MRAENEVVTTFDEKLEELTRAMLDLMYQADGIGLAAPQIGINKRIMVFNEEGSPLVKEKEMILINPFIISKSDTIEYDLEGCLSFPSIRGEVPRHQAIEVDYQTIKGEKRSIKFLGFPARLFQHEYDHLDKVLFIDRFNQRDKENNAKKLEKLIRRYGPGGVL